MNTSPITTIDPGPVPNGYMFSNTGLTNDTEYFYYVVAVDSNGVESRPSDITGAIPETTSVPWDTGNATQIINALSNLLYASGDPSLGLITACGPNGVIYQNYSDGRAEAVSPVGYMDSSLGSVLYSDGSKAPVLMDFTNGTGMLLFAGYTATNPPTGIFRKVEANSGYRGLKALVGLPPTSRDYSFVGSHYFPSTQDQGYIYTGGSGGGWEVDAGLQLGNTGNDGWKPYIWAKRGATSRTQKPVVQGTYWVTTSQPVLMIFKAPGLGNIPDKTIRLSFSSSNGILRDYRNSSGQVVRERISNCSFVCTVDGWHKTTSLRVKRVNAIAQDSDHIPPSGFAQSGSYIYGASWGQPDMQNSVNLFNSSGSSVTWTSGVTANEGSFPGSPYITKNVHNQFFWEDMIMMKTRL